MFALTLGFATPGVPVVGVMGSSRDAHAERAEPLGRWLAELGVHLLTGGGDGVMQSVSRAFHSVAGRRGKVIGVLPGSASGEAHPGYPNPWVEIAIRTHLPQRGARGADALSRNHVNVLSSSVLVALPGGAGTASEVALAHRYGRPVVAFLRDAGELPELPAGTRLAADLDAVKSFVEAALGIA